MSLLLPIPVDHLGEVVGQIFSDCRLKYLLDLWVFELFQVVFYS